MIYAPEMAQTRRKRQTKHRGNAAGFVESRGRTGRKPTAAEKKGDIEAVKRQRTKVDRRDQPPTWGGAFIRSMFASILMLVVLLLFKIGSAAAVPIVFVIALAFYTPVSYYTELWVFRRRQRAKQRGKVAQR